MAFKWNIESMEKLILCVQEYPCLYHVKSVNYLDRVKKAQAFNNILNELSKTESNITLEDIKRKWRILRNQYMREQRKIKSSKKSGAGICDVNFPKLWCFERLGFLESHIAMRESTDNTAVESDENIIYECSQEVPISQEQSKTRMSCSSSEVSSIEKQPRKSKKDPVGQFRNDLENFKNILSQRREKKFAWLGNLVTSQIERIHPEDQDDAAWQVQCLMRRLATNSSRKRTSSSSSSSKDILQLSMEGLFDDEDL